MDEKKITNPIRLERGAQPTSNTFQLGFFLFSRENLVKETSAIFRLWPSNNSSFLFLWWFLPCRRYLSLYCTVKRMVRISVTSDIRLRLAEFKRFINKTKCLMHFVLFCIKGQTLVRFSTTIDLRVQGIEYCIGAIPWLTESWIVVIQWLEKWWIEKSKPISCV